MVCHTGYIFKTSEIGCLRLQCGKHPLPPPPLPPAINIIYGQPLISHYYRERAGWTILPRVLNNHILVNDKLSLGLLHHQVLGCGLCGWHDCADICTKRLWKATFLAALPAVTDGSEIWIWKEDSVKLVWFGRQKVTFKEMMILRLQSLKSISECCVLPSPVMMTTQQLLRPRLKMLRGLKWLWK